MHPTYALFVAIPLARLRARARARRAATICARARAALVAFGAAGAARLRVARADRRRDALAQPGLRPSEARACGSTPPTSSSARRRATTSRPASSRAPGAIAVAALVLVPLAALAARRRWSALVLGGTVLVLALELSSFLFPHFSDLVSLSQSRRAAGFVPFAFALAGGAAVLTRALRALRAAGRARRGHRARSSSTRATSSAAHARWRRRSPPGSRCGAGSPGIVAAIVLARRGRGTLRAAGPGSPGSPSLLFVLPVAVHGFAHWDKGSQRDANALTPGLVAVPARRTCPSAPSSSPTSRRATASPPTCRSTSRTRRRRTSPTRRRTIRPARRTSLARLPADAATSRSRGTYGAGWLVLRGAERVGPGASPRLP